MKIFAIMACLFLVGADAQARGIRDDVDMVGDRARTSYAFGMMIGFDFRDAGLDLDFAAFVEGLIDAMERDEDELMMDVREAIELVQIAFELAMDRQAQEARLREELFLAANAERPEVSRTASGLQFIPLESGDGPVPDAGDTVIVHYEGALLDGTIFDSSLLRGFPETIPLFAVIPGWSEALQLMNVGSIYRFYIPSALAYGPGGVGNIIPPFATLIFTIELVGILE